MTILQSNHEPEMEEVMPASKLPECKTSGDMELTSVPRKPRRFTQRQLADALEAQLEQTLHHLMRETIAHNFFLVHLSPSDFAHDHTFKELAEAELVEYLQQVGESRDYKLLGAVIVEVVESSSILFGECLIESRIEQAETMSMASAWLHARQTEQS